MQLRGKVWTYDRRVPTHLLPALGHTFIKRLLGTGDIKDARRLRNIETVRVDALFESIGNGGTGGGASGEPARARTTDIPLTVLEEHVRAAVADLDRKAAERLAVDTSTEAVTLAMVDPADEVFSIGFVGETSRPDDAQLQRVMTQLRELGSDRDLAAGIVVTQPGETASDMARADARVVRIRSALELGGVPIQNIAPAIEIVSPSAQAMATVRLSIR